MRKTVDTISNQKLSQLLDGEWFELDQAECVASLCADKALRGRWARYHMIRDIVKGDVVRPDHTLSSRICAAVQDEPTYSNVTELSLARPLPAVAVQVEPEPEVVVPAEQPAHVSRVERSWFKTGLAGSALAASVALVTVVGLNQMTKQDFSNGSAVVASNASGHVPAEQAGEYTGGNIAQDSATAGSTLPSVEFVSNTGSYWVSTDSAKRASGEEQLNMMLSHHLESSPTASREGLLSYSRLVGYDERPSER